MNSLNVAVTKVRQKRVNGVVHANKMLSIAIEMCTYSLSHLEVVKREMERERERKKRLHSLNVCIYCETFVEAREKNVENSSNKRLT